MSSWRFETTPFLPGTTLALWLCGPTVARTPNPSGVCQRGAHPGLCTSSLSVSALRVASCFLTQSGNRGLSIGTFASLPFSVMTDLVGFKFTVLMLTVYVSQLFFPPFLAVILW